jgi:hypothetical protein
LSVAPRVFFAEVSFLRRGQELEILVASNFAGWVRKGSVKVLDQVEDVLDEKKKEKNIMVIDRTYLEFFQSWMDQESLVVGISFFYVYNFLDCRPRTCTAHCEEYGEIRIMMRPMVLSK